MGSKITAGSDCSHEIKRHLILRRKAMTNLDSILKSKDITLPTSLYSQSYGFSSESLAIKKAEYLLSLEADSLPSEPPGKPRIDMN